MRAEMLYIDPATCIDCGACVEECPVDAVRAEDDLTEATEPYLQINADYFTKYPMDDETSSGPPRTVRPPDSAGLRVAVVGTGPSGFYAAADLIARKGVQVDLYDRLPTPYGLIRAGVAPDHPETKSAADRFDTLLSKPNLAVHLGIDVGTDVTHEELLAHHHAVVYAVGASVGRDLGIPGASLRGCSSASDFVAWYNGHPDAAAMDFDLSAERAIIIGNGNVALDVARILVLDHSSLARTDIADHALETLRTSAVHEVVVLGRRGHGQAAFTTPELLALRDLPDVDLLVTNLPADSGVTPDSEPHVIYKARLIEEIAASGGTGAPRRIILDFCGSPLAVLGDESVTGVVVGRNQLIDHGGEIVASPTGESDTIAGGLVLHAVGYHGKALPGIPFDDGTGTIPNDNGRVVDPESGQTVRGVYVTGWIKRGPSGVIGTNKLCATTTVAELVDDFHAGLLGEPAGTRESFHELIANRLPDLLDATRWKAIDKAERRAGKATGRKRLKFTDIDAMVAATRSI